MASLAKMLNTVQKDNCTYSLSNTKQCSFCSSKTINFDVFKKTFSISNDENKNSFTLPLNRLAKIIDRGDEILYKWRKFSIRPDVFVELKYHEIFVCQHAFRQLLVCLGEPVWEDAPPKIRVTNFDEIIRITPEVHIQFSFNHGDMSTEKFIIYNYIYETKSYVPLSALEAMFNQRWDILIDLDYDEKNIEYDCIPESSRAYLLLHEYWSHEEYAVGFAIDSNNNVIRIVDKEETISIMDMKRSDFKKVLELYKCYKEHVRRLMLRDLEGRRGLVEELNSYKTISIQSRNFHIINESNNVKFEMPLIALVEIIRYGEEILMDLRTSDYDAEIVYWSNEHFHIKTEHYHAFRILSFVTNNGDHQKISIKAPTFEKLIRIVQDTDSSDHENMEVEESYFNKVRLNGSKSVEYSEDGRHFTLINEKNGKTITLPISARKAIQSNKMQILSELENIYHETIYGNKIINEYWRGEGYAIRTAIFPKRDIHNHVVQFTRIIGNDFMFVIKKAAFLKLIGE